jgi:hypothetical protein
MLERAGVPPGPVRNALSKVDVGASSPSHALFTSSAALAAPTPPFPSPETRSSIVNDIGRSASPNGTGDLARHRTFRSVGPKPRYHEVRWA